LGNQASAVAARQSTRNAGGSGDADGKGGEEQIFEIGSDDEEELFIGDGNSGSDMISVDADAEETSSIPSSSPPDIASIPSSSPPDVAKVPEAPPPQVPGAEGAASGSEQMRLKMEQRRAKMEVETEVAAAPAAEPASAPPARPVTTPKDAAATKDLVAAEVLVQSPKASSAKESSDDDGWLVDPVETPVVASATPVPSAAPAVVAVAASVRAPVETPGAAPLKDMLDDEDWISPSTLTPAAAAAPASALPRPEANAEKKDLLDTNLDDDDWFADMVGEDAGPDGLLGAPKASAPAVSTAPAASNADSSKLDFLAAAEKELEDLFGDDDEF